MKIGELGMIGRSLVEVEYEVFFTYMRTAKRIGKNNSLVKIRGE